MKQLQVEVPKDSKENVEEILEDFSNDISSGEVESNGESRIEFTVTLDSEKIDELTEQLKSLKDLKQGELSIRVLEQGSLIKKGQPTKGSDSTLSQQEIYSKAQESAGFSQAQWGLIVVSSAIAAYGLALDNVIVVIGAMMLAPILAPFVAAAVSLSVGDGTLLKKSTRVGVLSVLIAVFVSLIVVIPFPVSSNSTIQMVASPGLIPILLSLLVGSAAALSFSTGLRDQIAGVAVAVAVVPPLASLGIALKMLAFEMAVQAGSVAVINLLAVIASGFATFKLLGLNPETYYRQKKAERIKFVVPLAIAAILLISIPLTIESYHSFQDFSAQRDIVDRAESKFGDRLLETRFENGHAVIYVTGNSSDKELSSDRFEVKVIRLRTG